MKGFGSIPEPASVSPQAATSPSTEPYRPGQTYEVHSIFDLIQLWRRLPEDRADLMLSEMTTGIRLAGAHFNLLEALGMAVKAPREPMKWTDDDNGKTDINTFTADGKPSISLRARKATEAGE